MKITRTVTIDCKTTEEYRQAIAQFESEAQRSQGWTIMTDAILKRVTAIRVEETEQFQPVK